MSVLNGLLVRVTDVVMGPLVALPAWLTLTVLAAATAALVLAVMKAASNQIALAAAKRQVHADLFEMRLFNDDLRALLRAQGQVLRHNGTYVRLSLVPLLLTAIPLTLAITQLQSWYGYTGVTVGEPVLVTAELRGEASNTATLDAPGAVVDGPAMYFPTLRQLVWRVVPRDPGEHIMRLGLNGASYDKTLQVSGGIARRSPVRPSGELLDQLLEPSEMPLPADGPVAAIRVTYPEREIEFLGLRLHWLVVYVVASFAFVLLLRKPLGVVI